MAGEKTRVGIFDSGVGGLTVLHACAQTAPRAQYLYYGDNGNAPYGNRPVSEIVELTKRGVRVLLDAGAEVLLLACNTATAVCAERLRAELPLPVLGMEPAVKPAALCCGRVLVLATACTAQSMRLKNLLARFPQCAFTVYPAAELAGAIERRLTAGTPFTLSDHLPDGEFDGVVLGCTHYIFYREAIAAHYGVPVFDGNGGTAARLRAVLGGADGEREWSERAKTNKSLPCKWSGENACGAVFLGKWGKVNEKIYKQTFEL